MEKEELLENAKREAAAQAQQDQLKLALREPYEFVLRDNLIKLYPLTGFPNIKISEYAIAMAEYETLETAELISKLKDNINLLYKTLAMGVLNDPSWNGWKGFFKVRFLHWITWRSLRRKYDQADVSELLEEIIAKVGVGFFFRSTASVKVMNLMKRKRTKAEAELLQAEQKSEK